MLLRFLITTLQLYNLEKCDISVLYAYLRLEQRYPVPIYDRLQKKKKIKIFLSRLLLKKKLYNDIFRIVRVEIVEQDSTLSLKAPRKKLSGL